MIKIKIWGTINLQTSDLVESAIASISSDDEPVLIILNTPGGTLADSIAICDMLKAIPNPIITLAIGECESAGAMIFSCGTSRYIAKDTIYMIHQPMSGTFGEYQNAADCEEKRNYLAKLLNIYKKYIIENSNIPKEKLDYAFKNGNDLYLSYKECLKYKVATKEFISWNKLYNNENINIADERVASFDVLIPTQSTEE